MNRHTAEGVLLTGVYGWGKSSVAEEIAYLLEQRGRCRGYPRWLTVLIASPARSGSPSATRSSPSPARSRARY